MSNLFDAEYARLNKKQKQAVDTTEGPVMVIAGPGTGKTQVISLRIGNILKSTDTSPDGILCLTFTNSGVEAMRKRLREYIGPEAGKVTISTFHAFGNKLIEEFHHNLNLPYAPKMLDNEDSLSLVDHLLNNHEWKHIRPRNNSSLYFRDLKSLISLLIRERMSPEEFLKEIQKDIKNLKSDPENTSTRGARKGELKMEVVNKIESLEKTCEVVTFYKLYEEEKLLRNVMDYDDVLRNMVRLVTESEDARDTVRERYLYVLVDEHQDSSGIQNDFLRAVWEEVECPNIFVVGDDRQLIYGFSGASLSYFEEFKETFSGTKVITLNDNYRSTQRILDAAEQLLTSSLAEGKLLSQNKHDHPIELIECSYPRDEILRAGLFFKKRIEEGMNPEDCALLVPKNSHIRSAATVLKDLGLQVSDGGQTRLFDMPEVRSVINILNIIDNPYSGVDIANSILDPISEIPVLAAHKFIHETSSRDLSLESLLKEGVASGLLSDVNPLYQWGKKLEAILECSKHMGIYELIQHIGKEFLLDTSKTHEVFVGRVEIVRSLLHLALTLEEKTPHTSVKDYLNFLHRIEEYGEDIPLAIFGSDKGIRIKTLHGSKGLEFESVWIAHMNERSLMSSKRSSFSLPMKVKERIEEKDEATAKRELYVAITRAKLYCVLSYAKASHKGSEERLAGIVESLRDNLTFTPSAETEKLLLGLGPESFISSNRVNAPEVSRKDLEELVRETYHSKRVSVTLLNNFYECPWKWYYRSFLEVPEPLSESLEFGSVVHSAIEKIIKLDTTPSDSDIKTKVEEAILDCHIVEEKRTKRMTNEALIAVKRFVDSMLPKLYEQKRSEVPLSYKDPLVPKLVINGKIDMVEYISDVPVRVTDFKTGKTKKGTEIEKLTDEGRMSTYMRQLSMYTYLLENTGKRRVEIEASRLYFVEEQNVEKVCFETQVNEDHIELLKKDIGEYGELMESGKWTERSCDYKPHLGESECPYCKMAELYK